MRFAGNVSALLRVVVTWDGHGEDGQIRQPVLDAGNVRIGQCVEEKRTARQVRATIGALQAGKGKPTFAASPGVTRCR